MPGRKSRKNKARGDRAQEPVSAPPQPLAVVPARPEARPVARPVSTPPQPPAVVPARPEARPLARPVSAQPQPPAVVPARSEARPLGAWHIQAQAHAQAQAQAAQAQARPQAQAAPAQAWPQAQAQPRPQAHAQAGGVSARASAFPIRPGSGTEGSKLKVRTNFFKVSIDRGQAPQLYAVHITPEKPETPEEPEKPEKPVLSRRFSRQLIKQVMLENAKDFEGRNLVYDGRMLLYSDSKLPFEDSGKTFEVSPTPKKEERESQPGRARQMDAPDQDPAANLRRERKFSVTIQFAKTVATDLTQEHIQALDIVLREKPSSDRKYTALGRSFYNTEPQKIEELKDGLVGWCGFSQSVRSLQMGLLLNVNFTATAMLGPWNVTTFLEKGSYLTTRFKETWSKEIQPEKLEKVKKLLRGVKVTVTHRRSNRVYRVLKISESKPGNLFFTNEDNVEINVQQHFEKKRYPKLEWLGLPCLDVGSKDKPNYLPMEVCQIVAGQRCPLALQGEGALRCMDHPPSVRETKIVEIVKANQAAEDRNASAFRMQVSDKIETVDARILLPPVLQAGGRVRILHRPEEPGVWSLRDGTQFVLGGSVQKCAAVCFFRMNENQRKDAWNFLDGLKAKCKSLGMNFNFDGDVVVNELDGTASSEVKLRRFFERRPGLDLLLVVLPDRRDDWYGKLKKICEIDIGLTSQCCSLKNIRYGGTDQFLANVAMKINMKMGGRNTVLEKAMSKTLPTLGRDATIIFGADVTHPSPGEASESVPSIAAVVASQDWPSVSSYAGLFSSQEARVEMIQNLQTMVENLLRSFHNRNVRNADVPGGLPRRILFYRDGVGEGQFQQVLDQELKAIQQACNKIEPDYNPMITIVVVQKRHDTRFFPVDGTKPEPRSFSGGKRPPNPNIKAGTVVDTGVCHPTQFDFYLCSHAGLKGTSRPTHYHVLHDENGFTANQLQGLTNDLCSTYAKCTRSLSIVPPAKYAHDLAFRARCYMTPGVLQIPEPKEQLSGKMFYL